MRHPSWSGSGLNLPIDRRSFLRAGTILTSAGLLSLRGTPLFAAEAFEQIKGQYLSSKVDWQQAKGTTITLAGLQHPWMNAIKPLIPHFTALTGITVNVDEQSESEFVAKMPIALGSKAPSPDVFMAWAPGQAISGHWLEPLDGFRADPKLHDAAWYDDGDVFASARSFQTWRDGVSYTLAITAEAETLFLNKDLLDAKGLKVPTTFDQLYDAAKALKTADTSGIVLRAKPTGDAVPWTAGGFIFSYGGAIVTPDGKVAVNEPEAVAAVTMYGKLLRDAGPIGISSYHWYECVTDFSQGAAAMTSDSSNFCADFANPKKSTVAGKVIVAAFPSDGAKPAKPNMWHWQAGINAASANKTAAWLFLMWATSKPTSMMAAAAGLATTRSSAWASSAFKDTFGAEAADAALANLQHADGDVFKATWFNPKSAEILDAVAIAVNETVTGSKPAQEALDEAAGKITKAIG